MYSTLEMELIDKLRYKSKEIEVITDLDPNPDPTVPGWSVRIRIRLYRSFRIWIRILVASGYGSFSDPATFVEIFEIC